MKSRLRNVVDGERRYQALMFWCPGCETEDGEGGMHMLPVNRPDGKSWGWNGDIDRPTLTPSILTRVDSRGLLCHSFLVDGVFQFLSDSSHRYSGQNVPMPDLPGWLADEGEG